MKWHWEDFVGSAEMLHYMRRDLAGLARVVKVHVERRGVAVQAGGCLGIFPKWLAERFEAVYTFEPDPENFAALCHNAPERNIVKLQAAVGHERRLVNISHARRSHKPGRSHEGIRHVEGAGAIPTLRIDDLGLSTCDLIYLDVEGHELFGILGARETIARCRPTIVVEVNEMIGYVGETEASLRALLDGCGYEYREQIGSSDQLYRPRAA